MDSLGWLYCRVRLNLSSLERLPSLILDLLLFNLAFVPVRSQANRPGLGSSPGLLFSTPASFQTVPSAIWV